MLAWFQQQGRGYQTRMNAVLCAYYRASVTGG
ncbi:MAG: BrnA antitoxin family protein [Holosporales bacterium]